MSNATVEDNETLPPSPSAKMDEGVGDTTPTTTASIIESSSTPPPSSVVDTTTPSIAEVDNKMVDETTVEKNQQASSSSENDRKRKDYDDRNHNERRLDDSRSDRKSYDRRDDRRDYRRDDRRDDRNYDRRDDRRYSRDDYYDRRDDYRDDYRRDDRRDDRNYDRRDSGRRYEDRPRRDNRHDNDIRNERREETPKVDNVYIPPFKLRKLQQNTDKSIEEFQKLNWEALKKTLNGIVNKVNSTNIADIIPELFSENIIRGKGLLVRAIMKAQLASIQFSNVYSAMIAVVNTRIPEIGELLLKRLSSQFLKSFSRNDKQKCIASCHFIAHLVNQQVASEILAGQLLSLLLENATNDSVELAVTVVKECGKTLLEVAPKILGAVFEAFRNILHDGQIDRRVQYLVESLFNIRKLEFKDYPSITEELDLVEDGDRITHDSIEISKDLDTEDNLDIFQLDEEFEENEERYKEIKKEILGEDDEGEDESAIPQTSASTSETFGGIKEFQTIQGETEQKNTLLDPKTKTDEESTDLKRKIYLTIMSSLGFEEAAHKLLMSGLAREHDMEVCSMIIECCSQERSYLDFFGCLGERFCQLQNHFRDDFEECFKLQYQILHRYETSRLRNIAKLFSHLLVSDSISWSIFSVVKITETDTTSYSRIFLKILFQELQQKLGMETLLKRLLHTESQNQFFTGLFPKDNPKVVRFAINFWLLIDLPQLAEGLKIYLKEMATKVQSDSSDSDSDSSDSDSDSDSSDSD